MDDEDILEHWRQWWETGTCRTTALFAEGLMASSILEQSNGWGYGDTSSMVLRTGGRH
jgi:hypothetical protein